LNKLTVTSVYCTIIERITHKTAIGRCHFAGQFYYCGATDNCEPGKCWECNASYSSKIEGSTCFVQAGTSPW